MSGNLFNYKEIKQINSLEKMVGSLSHDVAVLKLELNNLKKDIEDRERARRNAM